MPLDTYNLVFSYLVALWTKSRNCVIGLSLSFVWGLTLDRFFVASKSAKKVGL